MNITTHGLGGQLLDKMAETIIEKLKALSDVELQALLKASKRADRTNCWYGRYDMAKGLLPFLEEEFRERPIRRRYEAEKTA